MMKKMTNHTEESLMALARQICKDAERYRWLRDTAGDDWGTLYFRHLTIPLDTSTAARSNAIDAAIDAAMQEGK